MTMAYLTSMTNAMASDDLGTLGGMASAVMLITSLEWNIQCLYPKICHINTKDNFYANLISWDKKYLFF